MNIKEGDLLINVNFLTILILMKTYDNHHYNPKLKEYARELRTESVSKAEKRLWKILLSRKQTGIRFLRQRAIHWYIVDFFAPELGLIIEIDGNSHFNKGDYDRRRQDKLEELGYMMIRFSEGDVIHNFDIVDMKIRHAIDAIKTEKGVL